MVCACLLYRLLSRNKKNVSYFYTCNVAYELLNLKTRKHDNIDMSNATHRCNSWVSYKGLTLVLFGS